MRTYSSGYCNGFSPFSLLSSPKHIDFYMKTSVFSGATDSHGKVTTPPPHIQIFNSLYMTYKILTSAINQKRSPSRGGLLFYHIMFSMITAFSELPLRG